MILLIIPLGKLALGGISEKYLPPDNSVRQAQEEFDKIFPGFRTEPLTLVIEERQRPAGHRSAGRRDPQQGDGRSPGSPTRTTTPTTMWKERPYLDGASKDPSVRVIQNGLVNRNDARQEDRRAAGDHAAHGRHVVRRRHTRAGAGQYPQPVRQAAADGAAADHHDDDPDVPGVRVAGAADQGGADERAHARLDDGRADVDVRRRARLRADELHAATADGADDRPDHRGDLRPVDRLRGVPGVPHGGGPRTRHVHHRGHPDRYRHHRPAHHRLRRWCWPSSRARSCSPTW